MKYVFFGTPEFAAIVLQKLIAGGFVPDAVICNPDRPVGRKKIMTTTPAKLVAQKYGISVFQPEKLGIGNWELGIGEVDFAVVAAYARIIPKRILSLPRLGTIGVHPSFLPRHRGPSPIQTAILDGDAETGVTLFLMDEKVDHGPLLAKREAEFPIPNFQFLPLSKALAELAGDMLVEMLPKFIAGNITPEPQDESQATYTKKFASQDAYINPIDLENALAGKDAEMAAAIERKIRALNPEPGVWTARNGKRIKLLEAEVVGGKLVLKKIHTEGKKPHAVS